MEATLVGRTGCLLGEGPVWSVRRSTLYWVDILGQAIWSYEPEQQEPRGVAVEGFPCCIVECEDGSFLLALDDALALIEDFDPMQIGRLIAAPWASGVRANDGKVDAAGRLWLGTMDRSEREPIGALYAIDGRLTFVSRLEGLTISNGIGWSTDGRTMFHVDTPTRRIAAYEFDVERGTIADMRGTFEVGPPGVPDGLCVDAEDGLWVAVWGGGCVRRYDADGTLTAVVELPCSKVTSCCFGGPGLDQLYVVTAVGGPDGGGLFVAEPGVGGSLPHLYRRAPNED